MPLLFPLQSIRKNCLWCANFSTKEVRLCPCVNCETYHFRMGKKTIRGSRIKKIRKYCLNCRENAREVKLCCHPSCLFYPYRMGKSPIHRESCINRHPETNFKK